MTYGVYVEEDGHGTLIDRADDKDTAERSAKTWKRMLHLDIVVRRIERCRHELFADQCADCRHLPGTKVYPPVSPKTGQPLTAGPALPSQERLEPNPWNPDTRRFEARVFYEDMDH